jgi:hypothetical protein
MKGGSNTVSLSSGEDRSSMRAGSFIASSGVLFVSVPDLSNYNTGSTVRDT